MTNRTKAVLITGAGSGIGRELALKLNAAGEYVILAGRGKEKLLETKEHLINKDSSEILSLDLRKTSGIKKAVDSINERLFIHTLVNNAGTTVFKTVDKTSESEVEEILATNLSGAILLTKAVLPEMKERKEGRIINILSVAANTIFTKSGIYSASKAGLLAFANVLREEVREFNISVTNVLPGATATPIWGEESLGKFSRLMMKPEDLAEVILNSTLNAGSAIVEELVVRPITGDIK